MLSSTLAAYLESIAGLIRNSKTKELPTSSFQGQTCRIGTGALKIPTMDSQGSKFIDDCFGIIFMGDANQSLKHFEKLLQENDAIEKILNELTDEKHKCHLLDTLLSQLRTELAEAQQENNALNKTIQKLRAGSNNLPSTPAPEQFSVYLSFPPNQQGKILAKAGLTVENIKSGFTFVFYNPKARETGGFWKLREGFTLNQSFIDQLEQAGAFITQQAPHTTKE